MSKRPAPNMRLQATANSGSEARVEAIGGA